MNIWVSSRSKNFHIGRNVCLLLGTEKVYYTCGALSQFKACPLEATLSSFGGTRLQTPTCWTYTPALWAVFFLNILFSLDILIPWVTNRLFYYYYCLGNRVKIALKFLVLMYKVTAHLHHWGAEVTFYPVLCHLWSSLSLPITLFIDGLFILVYTAPSLDLHMLQNLLLCSHITSSSPRSFPIATFTCFSKIWNPVLKAHYHLILDLFIYRLQMNENLSFCLWLISFIQHNALHFHSSCYKVHGFSFAGGSIVLHCVDVPIHVLSTMYEALVCARREVVHTFPLIVSFLQMVVNETWSWLLRCSSGPLYTFPDLILPNNFFL